MIPLGIQDDGIAPAEVLAAGASLRAQWVRIISTPDAHTAPIAQRIRDAHGEGLKVILTVGGTGTSVRNPGVKATLRWIARLPRADRYTIRNEPDLTNVKACAYRSQWMRERRVLGSRLLWGDFSSHAPLNFTQRAAGCGRLPRVLDFALHPYCTRDPLGHGNGDIEGCIDQLPYARKWLRRNAGVRVRWWLTEFGYVNEVPDALASYWWPRAIRQAARVRAQVLVAYTAKGASWDTRPKAGAWCVLTQGRDCPSPQVSDGHTEPPDLPIRLIVHDPILDLTDNYTNGGA